MDRRIEEALENPQVKSQTELKIFIKKIQSQLSIYEKELYDKELINEETSKRIKAWRSKLLHIIRENKQLPDITEEATEGEKSGMNTLKLMNRQLSLADTNQKTLEKSTLKLLQLDYSLNEIDKIILETGKKFENSVKIEERENIRLIISIIIFITVCIGIIIDKIRSKL